MSDASTNRVAFPLRRSTDEELNRWSGHPTVGENRRYPIAPTPELCAMHGSARTWTKVFRVWSRVDLEYYGRSRRSRILHDLMFPWERTDRVVKRKWKGFSTAVAAHGCQECRRWLRLRRARTLALTALTLCLLVVVPWATAASHQGLAQVSLITGIILIAVTVKCSRWIHEFTNAYINVDGTRLVISDAHPEYVREALALGAEKVPEPHVSV